MKDFKHPRHNQQSNVNNDQCIRNLEGFGIDTLEQNVLEWDQCGDTDINHEILKNCQIS